jgi:hypothetical protein
MELKQSFYIDNMRVNFLKTIRNMDFYLDEEIDCVFIVDSTTKEVLARVDSGTGQNRGYIDDVVDLTLTNNR